VVPVGIAIIQFDGADAGIGRAGVRDERANF
jgi:hypothetical protein